MKIILTFLISFTTMVAVGQPTNPQKTFDKLVARQVNYYTESTFSLDSLSSTIYNERFNKIKNKLSKFSIEDFECEIGSTIIASVLLNKQNQSRAILTFGACPEPEFYFYNLKTKKLIQSFSALNIIIPGDGSLYTSGHLNEFNLRRKYTFDGKKFIEDKQPFYYVGLKSITLNDVKIYSDKHLTEILTILPKENEIEVLIAEEPLSNKIYLVRTSFGITGWAALKADQYKSIDVEGPFYNND